MNSDSQRKEGGISRDKNGNQDWEDERGLKESSNILWKTAVVVLIILLIAISTALAAVVVLNKDGSKPETKEPDWPIEEVSKEPVMGFTKATGTSAVPKKRPQEVCITKHCIQAADSLISNIDDSVDPCEDFYKFVCGKYDYNNEISQGSHAHGKTGQMSHKMNRDIKVILEKPIQAGDFKGMNMAKTFYKSCLTQEKQKAEGKSKPLLEEVVKLFGFWPAVVDKWKPPATYSWEKLVAHLVKLNIKSIITVLVGINPSRNNESVIFMETPKISPELFDAFEKVTDKKTALKDSMDLKNMQEAMAKVPKDKTLSTKRILELKSELPNVDWDSILAIFPAEVRITDNDAIVIVSWNQFKNVLNVLSQSPKRVVQNYIYYTLVMHLIDLVPNIPRQNPNIPLWKLCVTKTTEYFGNIISATYVEKHMDVKKIDAVESMAETIRCAFIKTIEEAEWLDKETRSNALNKLNKMNMEIGHPEHIFNETFLMQGFEQVIIKEVEYAQNTLMLRRMIVEQNLNSLRKVVPRDAWPAPPVTINAFYHLFFNEMIFPAAFLQFPVISDKVPDYLNYGRLGMFIGHEMSHGFDYEGHKYNELGQLEEWWTNATLAKFMEKAECFIHQFNNITDPISGLTINGNQTVSENMADTGGLKLAYTAFTNLLSNRQSVPTLPGLNNYTPEQLFFIVFANFWCQIYVAKARETILKTDVHSLARYRVNYSLKNLPAFADAFNCSKSAKMRPKTRCELW